MTKENNPGKLVAFPQEPFWEETLSVIVRADNVETLKNGKVISDLLDFNSTETRERYGRAIATRLSRLDSSVLQGLVDLVNAHIPAILLEQLWRVLFCTVEPIVAKTYLELIWPREPGTSMDRNEVKSYIQTTFSQESDKLNVRLVSCLRHAGYVLPQGKQDLVVVGFGNLDNALLLLTHLMLARSPRTIKLSEIETAPYWRFLGFRKLDHVRIAFRRAEATGLLTRYAVVDHLEQITTRYSWDDLVAERRWAL